MVTQTGLQIHDLSLWESGHRPVEAQDLAKVRSASLGRRWEAQRAAKPMGFFADSPSEGGSADGTDPEQQDLQNCLL